LNRRIIEYMNIEQQKFKNHALWGVLNSIARFCAPDFPSAVHVLMYSAVLRFNQVLGKDI